VPFIVPAVGFMTDHLTPAKAAQSVRDPQTFQERCRIFQSTCVNADSYEYNMVGKTFMVKPEYAQVCVRLLRFDWSADQAARPLVIQTTRLTYKRRHRFWSSVSDCLQDVLADASKLQALAMVFSLPPHG
jgi:hypothetical protein